MPQFQIPIFPEGVTYITKCLAFEKKNGTVTYFNASMPVFTHDESDKDSFQMITAQFCVLGNSKQAEIVRACGVTSISVKRAVKLYRAEGAAGFYAKKRVPGPAVLTKPVLEKAQELFDEGFDTSEVAKKIDVKADTLSKAVRIGKVHKQKKSPLKSR